VCSSDLLDLYLIHEPDPETPLEETLAALDDCVRTGRVLYAGASNIEAWRLARVLSISEQRRFVRFECVQNSYSLLDRAAEREMFPLCADAGVGFIAFSPLAGGWLTGKYGRGKPYPDGSRMTLRPEPYRAYEREEIYRGLDALANLARTRGVEMSALALAWVLHQPRVDSAVIGPRRPEHLASALAALTIAFKDEETAQIGALFDLA